MRRLATIGVSAALVVALLSAPGAAAKPAPAHATWAGRWSVPVGADVAHGWLAYPTDITPDTLLVFGHGCCGPLTGEWADYFALRYARERGMVVVAMDYRGRGGWDVLAGSQDLVAATEALRRAFPIRRTIAWGVSMGGEVTGMAVAARADLFDYWISSMGVADLATQWHQPTFRRVIERETGGTPSAKAKEYERRSPVALAPRMKGLKRAYLLHGAADLAVLPAHSHQMHDRLVVAGVPVSTYTILTSGHGFRTWWPVRQDLAVPMGPAGHDVSSVALAERVIVAILSGRAPDRGEPSQHHVWDQNLDRTLI